MIATVYIFAIFLTSVWMQAFFGYFGVIVPFSALSMVYITIVYGWRIGIFYSIVTGLVTGLLYGDFITNFRIFQMVIISVVSVVWLYKGDVKIMSLQFIPGAVASFLYSFPLIYECYDTLESGFFLVLKNVAILIFAVVAGGVIFPFYIKILDFFSNKLKLDRYTKAKERWLKGN